MVTKAADQFDIAWQMAALLHHEPERKEQAGFVNFELPDGVRPLEVADGLETTTTNYHPSHILAVRSTLLLHRQI